MWSTLESSISSNNLDVQTETKCHLDECLTVWTLQAGSSPQIEGYTIRAPDGETLRIPVEVVDTQDAENDDGVARHLNAADIEDIE